MVEKRQYSFGSCFAGIGGLDLGFERVLYPDGTPAFKCAWQVENDDYATKILERHWPNVRRHGDIKTFPPNAGCELWNEGYGNEHWDAATERCMATGKSKRRGSGGDAWRANIVLGGFPCQDISSAGAGVGIHGPRSGLFFEFIRVVRELRPSAIVLENVPALLGRGMDTVLASLAEIGFDAEWHCVPCAAFGAPHVRDRVFIVGHATGEGSFPPPHSGAHSSKKGRRPRDAKSERRGCDGIDERENGATERRVGDLVDGFSAGMDGHWDIEPANTPRVTTGEPDRVSRLRCLGNAVVPQVATFIGEVLLRSLNGRPAR